MYHVVDEGNGCRSFQRNPNRKVITKLDWSCVATSVEDFAKVICSKEDPREYAVERVLVDYDEGTIEQTAVYMPGGPEPVKTLPPVKQENTCDANLNTQGEGLCSGMTFVIPGKVNIFKNRDEFIAYVGIQGGKAAGSVSKNTNYLVNNDSQSTSSKNQKARDLCIPIITEEEFVDRFGRP